MSAFVNGLQMALLMRKPFSGVVHHSDRGTQYTSLSFGQKLEEAGVFPSMGRVGSALDNAMAEAFVASMKTELEIQTGSRTFANRDEGRTATFEFIEGFYNTSRRDSWIGNVSPADYERAIVAGEVRAT